MKLEDVKLSHYKYKVKSMILTYGKTPNLNKYEVDGNLITRMEIVKNFDGEIFPFFTVTFSMPNSIYRELIKPKNKNNIKVNLHIQKGKFNETWKVENYGAIPFKDCIKGIFHAIIGPKELDLTEKEQEMIEKSGYEYGQLNTLTMALYPKDYYDNFQTVINANLEAVTVTDALVYLLNKAKIKNVLLSPSDNKKKYSQMLLLPIQVHKMISRLCDKYRFHNKGSIIFFDLDRFYIIDKSVNCTAYTENEYKLTYIIVSTSSQPTRMIGGSYVDDKKKINVLNCVEISPNDNSDITKKVSGDNTISIDAEGNVVKTNKKATKITNVVVQNEGSHSAKAIKRSLTESKKIIACQLQNEDITMIKPNKSFILSIEGKKYDCYNGKYRLTLASHVFEKEGNYFTLSSIIHLSAQ